VEEGKCVGIPSNDRTLGRLAACGRLHVLALGAGLAALVSAPVARAQAPPQQYVYTTTRPSPAANSIAGFAENGQTGALTAVPGSSFGERLDGTALAVDALGRFVFVLNPANNDISMFRIEPSTGALSEVPGSPFAAGSTDNALAAPTSPNVLATEKSGQYLYVGYRYGSLQGNGAMNEYAIDRAHEALVPAQQSGLDLASSPVGIAADPKGLYLYVALGPNSQTGEQDAQINIYAIDPATGGLALNGAGGGSETGRCMAVDPKGRFLFYGHGYAGGFIESAVISPVDGVPLSNGPTIDLGEGNFPGAMAVESGGKHLYVWAGGGGVRVYSIDQTTSALTEVQGSPQQLAINASVVADPLGPFVYSVDVAGVHGYQVDAPSGLLAEIAGSPFAAGGPAAGGIAITGVPAQAEPGPGPATAFVPASAAFGSWVVGTTSNTIIVRLVNTGSQTLSIPAISIGGTDNGDFAQTNTCAPTLDPNKNCAISLNFTPSALGSRQASLTFSDNAAGSPQSVPLDGTGVAPRAAVTLSPGTMTFAGTPVGETGAAQIITVTNSGATTLLVAGVTLGGPNPDDFAQTNDCSSVAVNATCTVRVTFTPQAQGPRTATLSLTDNAPAPQPSASLSGTGDPPFSVAPSGSSSTSASINAGETAQFNMQVTPAARFSGVVSLTCSGAPAGASCQVSPSAVQLSGASPAPFRVTVTTTHGATASPAAWPRRPSFLKLRVLPLFALFVAALVWLAAKRQRPGVGFARAGRFAWSGAAAALILSALLTAAGCVSIAGGPHGSQPAASSPQNIALTVTASWGNVTQNATLTVTIR